MIIDPKIVTIDLKIVTIDSKIVTINPTIVTIDPKIVLLYETNLKNTGAMRILWENRDYKAVIREPFPLHPSLTSEYAPVS